MFRYLEGGGNHTNDNEIDDEENSSTNGKPWGEAIGAALIVQMVTLSGLVLVALSVVYRTHYVKDEKDSKRYIEIAWTVQHLIIPSFAIGALLATSAFLIIPEALHVLEGHSHSDEQTAGQERDNFRRKLTRMIIRRLTEGNENSFNNVEKLEVEESASSASEVAWKFGTAFLGGFIFPFVFGSLFSHKEQVSNNATPCKKVKFRANNEQEYEKNLNIIDPEVIDASTNEDTTGGENHGSSTEDIPSVALVRNNQLALSIVVGDFFHNITDGFFIGSAFLLCSKTLAWTMVASTIYHEIAQEIADFFLLTTRCGLSIAHAIFLNFCSGMSVILGVIIVFLLDLEDVAIGVILSISAGVFIYIAAAECAPSVQNIFRNNEITKSKKMHYSLVFLFLFTLGAVPIGLVLLNHEHCDAKN